MNLEQPNLKCPWNNFADCFKKDCPFYGLLWTTMNNASTLLEKKFDDYYGCRRAQPYCEKNTYIYQNEYVPDACRNCSNHPSNGGSGICFCTLGTPKVT